MKLAFSTIGCPDWTFEEIFATAKDMGYDGIEIRGVGNELYAPAVKQFKPQVIEKTKSRLTAAHMEIPMLTSSACLGRKGEQAEAYIQESKAYMDLANKLGAPYIRVLCSKNPQPDTPLDEHFLEEVYTDICRYGQGLGVTPLIETNGFLADSAVMARLLSKTGSSNRGVLWDIHHPYRFFGESPEKTVSLLGSEIKYLHVKDSVMENGQVRYRMLGEGDVPVPEVLKAVKKAGFEGYVTFEWVKRWVPDLEEPGIVFARYMDFMKEILEQI